MNRDHYRSAIDHAAPAARELLFEQLGTSLRLCLHQAEATRRILRKRDVPARVALGAIQLVLGEDSESPLEMHYDPQVNSWEWHAWVCCPGWLVDPSIADLHAQLVQNFGLRWGDYRRLAPFERDHLAIRLRPHMQAPDINLTVIGTAGRASSYREVPALQELYLRFLEDPRDMAAIEALAI